MRWGWRSATGFTSSSMRTDFVLDALEQAHNPKSGSCPPCRSVRLRREGLGIGPQAEPPTAFSTSPDS